MAQFDDGHQIAGAGLHTADNLPFYFQTGEEAPGPMEAPVNGRLLSGDGTVQFIRGSVLIDDWVRSTDSPDPDQYEPTQTWYPNHWQYTFGEDTPEHLRSFSMEPIVDGGQSGFFANGAQYSEGAVIVRELAGDEVGRGFAESVNYADTAGNILRLAGLPETDEMLELIQLQLPSDALQAESIAYVMAHQDELNEVIAACIGLS